MWSASERVLSAHKPGTPAIKMLVQQVKLKNEQPAIKWGKNVN